MRAIGEFRLQCPENQGFPDLAPNAGTTRTVGRAFPRQDSPKGRSPPLSTRAPSAFTVGGGGRGCGRRPRSRPGLERQAGSSPQKVPKKSTDCHRLPGVQNREAAGQPGFLRIAIDSHLCGRHSSSTTTSDFGDWLTCGLRAKGPLTCRNGAQRCVDVAHRCPLFDGHQTDSRRTDACGLLPLSRHPRTLGP